MPEEAARQLRFGAAYPPSAPHPASVPRLLYVDYITQLPSPWPPVGSANREPWQEINQKEGEKSDKDVILLAAWLCSFL